MASILIGRGTEQRVRAPGRPRRIVGSLQLLALLTVTCVFIALIAAAAFVGVLIEFTAFTR